jgi:inorganic pyrophosphatase
VSDRNFWAKVDALVEGSSVVVDRPKGTPHPRIRTLIYPLDYGYLSGTRSGDGHGVDVWVGSLKQRVATGVVCTVDLSKGDAELKILLGCTRAEQVRILAIHNYRGGCQAGILIRRHTMARRRRRTPVRPRSPSTAHAR